MARQRTTLDAWIRGALSDPDKDNACTVLALVHLSGSTEKEIHAKKIGTAADPKALADMFRAKAETYAQDLTGIQSFALHGFYGRDEPEATFPFTVEGDFGLDGQIKGTFAPTAAGEKQQNMQMTQAVFISSMNQTRLLFEASQRMIEEMGRREDRLLRDNHEMFDILRETMMAKISADQQKQAELAKYERDTKEREKWMKMIPLLANTISGRQVFPTASADTAIIEAFADNVSEEQIKAIMPHIPPAVMGALAGRVNQYLAEKRERAEEAAKHAQQGGAMPPGNIALELEE